VEEADEFNFVAEFQGVLSVEGIGGAMTGGRKRARIATFEAAHVHVAERSAGSGLRLG